MRRLGRLAILLALCAGIAPRVSAQARGQATVTPDRTLLQSLAGEYTAGTITMTVTLLEDGTLTLFFPGQQLYHLVPETRFRYRMRELNPGFGIQFLRDVNGTVTGMTVRQPPPQQDFSAVRKPGQTVRAPQPAYANQPSQESLAQAPAARPSPPAAPPAPAPSSTPVRSAAVAPAAPAAAAPKAVAAATAAPAARTLPRCESVPAASGSRTGGSVNRVTTEKVTIFYRPTIGGMIGAGLTSLAMNVQAAMQLAAQFSSDIAASRKRFVASFPNGADFCAANAEFSELLRQKDLHYLMLAVLTTATERPSFGSSPQVSWGSIARKLTPVDGGIKTLAMRDFVTWSGGVTDAIGIRPDNLTISSAFGMSAALAKALPANETRYANYVHARDFAEYWESGADLSRGFDARTFAILALENYLGAARSGFAAALPDDSSEEAAVYAYERLSAILGTQPILAASEKILAGRKDSYPDPGGALVSMLVDHPKALVLNVLRPSIERAFRRSNFDSYDRAIAQYGEAKVIKVAETLWKGRNAVGGYGSSAQPLGNWFEKLAKDPATPLPPPIPRFSASDLEGILSAKLGFRDLLIVEGTLEGFRERNASGLGDVVDIGFKENPAIVLRLRDVSRGEIDPSRVVGRRIAVEGQFTAANGGVVLWLFKDEIRALLAR